MELGPAQGSVTPFGSRLLESLLLRGSLVQDMSRFPFIEFPLPSFHWLLEAKDGQEGFVLFVSQSFNLVQDLL